MKGWMRWVLLIGGGLVAAALIGAGVLAYLVYRLDVRGEVERIVENAAGRDVVISGGVGVSYWPVLGLRADDVTLANVEGGRAPSFIAADEIDIGVSCALCWTARCMCAGSCSNARRSRSKSTQRAIRTGCLRRAAHHLGRHRRRLVNLASTSHAPTCAKCASMMVRSVSTTRAAALAG